IKFLTKYKNCVIFGSCVVKEIKKEIKKEFSKVFFVKSENLKDFIKIKYKDVKKLGTDRILAAFAVKEIFGGNSLIILCGTALVIDYINNKCEYLGGEIFPGIYNLLNTLHTSTSQLPFINFKDIKIIKSNDLIGRTTFECISKGIINFVVSGIKNLIKIFNPRFIIITGGEADIVGKYLDKKNMYVMPELVLLGLILFSFRKNFLTEDEFLNIIKNFITS
ncbi:MAG: type III pantothenate kinase, partial [Elusimicrobiota bacterium]|nr:type III pantothenate kinase [Endomicrobiia bacterium]MDW8166640.1 type III pantothenate kinase [Elusimicrobiota bacterium]